MAIDLKQAEYGQRYFLARKQKKRTSHWKRGPLRWVLHASSSTLSLAQGKKKGGSWKTKRNCPSLCKSIFFWAMVDSNWECLPWKVFMNHERSAVRKTKRVAQPSSERCEVCEGSNSNTIGSPTGHLCLVFVSSFVGAMIKPTNQSQQQGTRKPKMKGRSPTILFVYNSTLLQEKIGIGLYQGETKVVRKWHVGQKGFAKAKDTHTHTPLMLFGRIMWWILFFWPIFDFLPRCVLELDTN